MLMALHLEKHWARRWGMMKETLTAKSSVMHSADGDALGKALGVADGDALGAADGEEMGVAT